VKSPSIPADVIRVERLRGYLVGGDGLFVERLSLSASGPTAANCGDPATTRSGDFSPWGYVRSTEMLGRAAGN
jgi:hypothetical protein